jgi:hypothetical protein
MMQVAAVHPERSGGGRPVAVVTSDGLGDNPALELEDLVAQRAVTRLDVSIHRQ